MSGALALPLAAGGCASGAAEAEAVHAGPTTAIAAAPIDDATAAKLLEQKRARLVRSLERSVGEADEQIEMIEDTIYQREACREPEDEDERITAIYDKMTSLRAALQARRAHAEESIARLRGANLDEWARASWGARMAVDNLETETELAVGKLY